jgi:hypothetical protein
MRNLVLYHEWAFSRRRQVDLAREFRLGQGRVSQIARQVAQWVDQIVQPRHFRRQPGMRMHLAVVRELLRLRTDHAPLLQLLDEGKTAEHYVRRYVAVVDGRPIQTLEITDRPSWKMFNQAIDVAGELAELEAVTNLGPFANVLDQVQQTIQHESEPAETGPNMSAFEPLTANRAAETPTATSDSANVLEAGGLISAALETWLQGRASDYQDATCAARA